MLKFIILNIILIVAVLYISYNSHNKYRKKRNEKSVTLYEFLNKTKNPLKFKTISIGLIFGFIFGFIDNIGLLFGLNNFAQYIPGGLIMKSTIGNTYSDGLGALIGSGLSVLAKDKFDYDNEEEPVWVNFIGVVGGCFLGVLVSVMYVKLTTGKPLSEI